MNEHFFGTHKGWILALTAGIFALGIAILALTTGEKTPVTLPEPEPQKMERVPETVPVLAEATLPPETEAEVWNTTWPVDGEAVAVYAMDKLSFNETTQDWRVHNGLDLAAPEGTEVRSAAPGTVYTVYEDPWMGHTVVVQHRDGYVSTYASLSPEVSVTVGQTVECGTVLGTVGSSALAETALSPHVHFAVSKNGQSLDPAAFIEGQ